ncbi:MAG: SAM-dependent methyltransferase [Fimbriimonas sp.]
MTPGVRTPGSFRDPSGFIFERDGVLYRQVNRPYAADLDLLDGSGLHEALAKDGLLIRSERVDDALALESGAVAVLAPERVPFVSYPYEWCFGQLRDAALLTLDAMDRALAKGMILKDASAYNVQFLRGKPILIDTLSFTTYREGEPWVAYRQFCQHFLAPLALMAYVDVRLAGLLRVHVDGIPLDLAARLLPAMTRVRPGLLTHLHLHAKAQSSAGESSGRKPHISLTALRALVDSLRDTIRGLPWNPPKTAWGDYYGNTNYADEAMAAKRALVAGAIDAVRPKPATCWDLGANTGEFSILAAERGIETVAWDVDPVAVQRAYEAIQERWETRLLPLLQDLTNPSPDQGWAQTERDSLAARGPVDLLMALALIHHLAIGNNVPLPSVARSFAGLGRHLVIEFVPKEDSQVARMLSTREDVFPDYTQAGFEAAFDADFEVLRREAIPGTTRTLYLMRRRS